MIYVVAMLMLVCSVAGAILFGRGRRKSALWTFGLAGLLALNLAVYGLVGVLSLL